MAINSYFYDSVNGDRSYSAVDFTRAFGMILTNGVIGSVTGNLGFDTTSSGTTLTVEHGRATIEGHFVEVTDTEIVTVPSGSYAGQLVIRVDISDERLARLIVKTDQNPIQDAAIYELPLYNLSVTDGIATIGANLKVQGGAIAKTAANVVTWQADTNGVRMNTGLFSGNGKPVVLFLTSAQPSATSTEHRVWIQIDKF